MNCRHVTLRRAGAALLAASLVLSAIPASSLPSLAAPRALTESEDAGAAEEHPGSAATEKTDDRADADGATSVRPRGREAPVSLFQGADDEVTSPVVGADPDPGDGPPPRKDENASAEAQDGNNRRNANLRMWPLPAESYTFTQAFGCVPQIAHFYQPGAGCPPDRPVVHTGLDLAAPEGTPFYAAASGWVTEAGYDREVGVPNTRIIIQHEGRNDGYATEYLHWIASFVDVGDHVEAGQLIGEVGSVGYSTGPHLHFSLIDLDTGEHVDPTRWLPEEPGTEGYRGVTPRRAAMRLPAGTTAGVPEYTDPAPPDLPTREDLPDTAESGRGRKDREKRKKAKQREERRNGDKAGKNRNKNSRNVSGKDGSTSENSATESEDKQTERTRKRERNKNGAAKSKDASGENGSGESRKSKKGTGGDSSSRKDEKRANRKDNNTVEQTDTREKGKNRNGSNGGGGGGNKQNRQKTEDQQVAQEPTSPEEETPPQDSIAPEETDSNPGGKDESIGADSADSDVGDEQTDDKRERPKDRVAGDDEGIGDGSQA